MNIDEKIAHAKKLIAQREALDSELRQLFDGEMREQRVRRCSACGQPGHRASTCPGRPAAGEGFAAVPVSDAD